MRRYSTQRPKFQPYAFMAAGFWTVALLLQLGLTPMSEHVEVECCSLETS